jgi:hypothetical protein
MTIDRKPATASKTDADGGRTRDRRAELIDTADDRQPFAAPSAALF